MAFKMKGFPFSGKSPMKQGATNPSKDIDILEEETTEKTVSTEAAIEAATQAGIEGATEASEEEIKKWTEGSEIDFGRIEKTTNVPQNRIRDAVEMLTAKGETLTTQKIIDHFLKREIK